MYWKKLSAVKTDTPCRCECVSDIGMQWRVSFTYWRLGANIKTADQEKRRYRHEPGRCHWPEAGFPRVQL